MRVLSEAVPDEATSVFESSASDGKVRISPAIGGEESPLPCACFYSTIYSYFQRRHEITTDLKYLTHCINGAFVLNGILPLYPSIIL